ncbi:MAG: hypothetical protein J6C23_08400 [Clostridia bacterium]|nr:hypothetical protein [Clostridia bacterium]
MCERYKSCAIIGHRNIEVTEELKERIYSAVYDLIQNKGVKNFLFGSRSEFNSLCYEIVLDVKQRFDICMCVYTCKHEAFVSFAEEQEMIWIYEHMSINGKVLAFDKEVEFDGKHVAGKSSYVQRNYAMINDSDYCLFYYNPNGKTANSGTRQAYTYAQMHSKTIINLY